MNGKDEMKRANDGITVEAVVAQPVTAPQAPAPSDAPPLWTTCDADGIPVYLVKQPTYDALTARIAELEAERDALKAENTQLKTPGTIVLCAHCAKSIEDCKVYPCPERYKLYIADLKAYIGET
jgi:hypothetical protein